MPDPVLVTNPARPRDHGSGFVIRRLDGAGAQVVTCSHVVRTLGVDGLQVAGQPAKVIIDLAADGVDLAVLAVPGLTEPGPLELQRGTAQDEVLLHGFEPAGGGPLAVPHRGRLAKASITALGGHNRSAWHLELSDGDIEGGHSGGPVVSVRTGKVVGVISMGPDQQGGKDGVAVGIENLGLWKDAPPIAPARPATETPLPGDGDGGGGDSGLLPEIIRPVRRWWWVAAIAAALAAGGAALVVRLWPSSPPASTGCAIPDLRDSFERVAVADWCPDTVAGAPMCRRQFDDGSVVTGTCVGTAASGDWRSVDPQGLVRWEAHFDQKEARVGRWLERRVEASGATFTATTRFDVAVAGEPGKLRSERTEEWRCDLDAVSEARLTFEDVTGPLRTVTLKVPAGSSSCNLMPIGAITVVQRCTAGARTVTGEAAVAAYGRLIATQDTIQRCQPTALPGLPSCGDGKLDAGEECDDGRQSERCTQFCKLSRCGDGVVNPKDRETCDPGDAGQTERCDSDCTRVECGDGLKNALAGERCDPPPRTGTTRCETNCLAPRCGDGIVNKAKGEQCDAGGITTATCFATCKTSRCGDGVVNAPFEECDDGRKTARCTADCKKTIGVPVRPIPIRPATPQPVSPISPVTPTVRPISP